MEYRPQFEGCAHLQATGAWLAAGWLGRLVAMRHPRQADASIFGLRMAGLATWAAEFWGSFSPLHCEPHQQEVNSDSESQHYGQRYQRHEERETIPRCLRNSVCPEKGINDRFRGEATP